MKLNVSGVMQNENTSLSFDYRFPFEASLVTVEKDMSFGEMSVRGTIVNKAQMVILSFDAQTEMRCPCDRCLAPVAQSISFHGEFYLVREIHDEENEYLLLVEGDELDIDEQVLSCLVLELPSKHLCKPDCKGICAKCGKDLNEGECNCPKREIDPRLAKLGELLQ